jgi:DNA (cytosine-5)-methyltransferase 1
MRDPWDPRVPTEPSAYNWKGEPTVLRPLVEVGNNDLPGVVDLFCGCGGFSEGFRQAGFRCILGLDILIPAIQTFRRNHPEAFAILGDVRRVPEHLIKEICRGIDVAVLTAGIPCQGFSRLNRKRWDDDERNYLFLEFLRIVKALRPTFVVLENVTGLRVAKGGEFVRVIVEALGGLGYEVEARVLDASLYGVPQRRERIFFIGALPPHGVRWPRPTYGPGTGIPPLTVRDAIGDLPRLGVGETKTRYECEPFTEYQRTMREGSGGLYNHTAPRQHPSTVERILRTEPGTPMYESFPQRIRLAWDRPSPTIVAGGIRPQFFYGHPSQARGLTVREMCRLQSFPDRYIIEGGMVQGRVQVGNAVPPLLARAIAWEIMASLMGKPQPELSGARQLKLPIQ